MKTKLHINILTLKSYNSENNNVIKYLLSGLKKSTSIAIFFILSLLPELGFAQAAASSNYATQTGTLETTYSWINCEGTTIVSGDDAQASISWPFDFSFYDNTYTTANSLSVCTNGFIRLDGTANTDYAAASAYNLTSTATQLGQIIALAVYDGDVGSSSWVKSLVTGTSPNRIFTIEYNYLEIDYNDDLFANIQVSFYETSNKVVLKLGTDDINKDGVDMGLHSGVNTFYNKWQEVKSGTNNTWVEYTPTAAPNPPSPPAASWNYGINTGATETTYSWIDCSAGSDIVSGDDEQTQINWPFDFSYYDNNYTTSNLISVSTNAFLRLDGVASVDYIATNAYDLTSDDTSFGQIIALAMYDDDVSATSWVRSLVTGTAPNRVFTIEYDNLEIDYDDGKFMDVQVSFYESINKIVLKLGTDNITKSGADMGLHSGVNTFFDKWQEVLSGANNTWIEYSPPYVEVNATVGTSMAYYTTLKAAFDKINDGTHQGEITIKLNNSTTEPVSAVLNASGTGAANYASVNMYPTETGLSITGNMGGPLIDLNGADNVIIDGRVNATGTTKDLSIINTYPGSTTGTSAIRFINGASNNTVKYCTIKSSESKATSGIIFFSTTTSSSGNSNNIIENNDITNAADASRPVNVIYSLGTAGKDNSGNIIRNNNIYDFIKHASASRGILLVDNTTAWTIDGNSFYETASFTGTGTVTYDAIKISNISGNGFTVSNNYFGGSAPECGGTAWTKINATNNLFNAIYLKVGTTVASSVQNNTIQNFNWSNSGNATWTGINVIEGSVDIGTLTGNTVGATTGTNSINVTGGTNGQYIYGIKLDGTGVLNCNNNSIGSITGLTAATLATHIYGIGLSGSAITHIENNTIGSATTANSIFASSASTASLQKIYGIYTKSTGTTGIHENTISNLRNNTSNAAVGTRGLIYGMYLTYGTNTIDENTIRDISIANANTSSYTPSIAAINLDTKTEAQSIHQNLIYNISNTSTSFTGLVVGIFTRNSVGASAGDIDANFIHSLSVDAATTGAKIYGIYENTDGIVYSNNIITLGGSTSTEMYGIYDVGNSGKTGSFFFNSIYISGTNSGSEKSSALRYNTSSNTRDLRNNILFNARSGGSSSHYAIYYDNTSGTFTSDYNDYFVGGTGGIIAYYSGDKATLALLQAATSQDVSSLNIDPLFASAGGTNADDYVTSASLPGVAISGITTTYHGITRSDSPKMGALEVSPVFTWQGASSTDFATAGNWAGGAVPPNGADILFAATPANDCYLDQNRTLRNITNTSSKKLVVNAKQLTITGNIVSATANQLDVSSASSVVIFAGSAVQSISSGIFVSNTIDGLELNNIHGLTQNGDLILSSNFTLTGGAYSIGANTLTINGAISTTSGSLTGGSSSNIIIGGSGASTTLPGVSLNNLTINRANGISTGGAISVAGTLTLTAGTLSLGANTLTISGNTPTLTSGNIDASNASSTVVFTNSSAISLAASLFTGAINNLTINGAGLTAGSDLTVNGVLNLESANPSASKGSLDMGAFTLEMGLTGTTTGTGDVTGIVKRSGSFTGNIAYSFGNQFTTVTFVNTGTKPSWLSCQIVLGEILPDKTGSVLRYYSFAKDAATYTDQTIVNLHYLDAELNGNTEDLLVFWDRDPGIGEHGKTNNDEINNWVGLSGLSIDYLAPSATHPSTTLWGLGDASGSTTNTWSGASSTEWNDVANWTGGAVPTTISDVLIPTGLTNYPSLTASSNAVAKTIEIASGASITANAYNIDISGSTGAWYNNGTFIPGTGTVTFSNGDIGNVVSFSGSSIHSFYNLVVAENTYIQPSTGTIIQIENNLTQGSGSILDFTATSNTIEYSGSDQTVLNPVGPGTDNGYNNVILSGSGTKTLSGTAMIITGNFNITGTTTTVSVGAQVDVAGNMFIDVGDTINAGTYTYNIGGNITNNGTFNASAGNTIVLNGASLQAIDGSSTPANFYNLTIDNNAGVVFYKDVNVYQALTLSNGNMIIGENTLGINGTISQTSGYIETSTLSSLSFGGTTALSLASNLFYTTPSINNLTINRTEGVSFNNDITVNGELNLEGANPSSGIIGSLDMGTDILNLGENATTTGIGDVTGIIKREHTFITNTEYTFGSQYTTINFIDGNLTPTWISVKVSIGAVPGWTSWTPNGKVKRLYKLACSDNSSTALSDINMRYLVSEMDATDNDEHELVFWHKKTDYASGAPHEHGKAVQDLTNHSIGVIGLLFASAVTTDLDDSQVAMAYSLTAKNTWKGEVSGHETEWEQTQNWTAGTVPLSTEEVLIPGGLTYYPSLTASANAVAGTIEIETGASITANSYNITISGSGGAWINEGTFTPGTGTVTFDHGVSTKIVTVAGITNFYNISVAENTTLAPVPGCTFRIAGAASATSTSKADWSAINSTVEWNGVNQNINNPQGIGGNSGFYNLILSGSGTKTMPSSELTVHGDFTTSGTASATAADSIIVLGNTTIDNGATFATGANQHFLSGNFENNGTFTPTSGGNVTFEGTLAQTISGSSSISFDGLCISNLLGVSMTTDVNVNNVLSFCNGQLSVGDKTLGINGTIYNPSGYIDVNSNSSLSFGGTSAITLNNNLFSGDPTIDDLTINRSGGVTLGNESITVNGALILTSGTLTLAANTLTIAKTAPTRTSGNIDASNTSANLEFTNTSAITLPASLFDGNVNNMTLNGAGGITAGGDFTLDGILNLQSANPSSSKGSVDMTSSFTLTMGASSTTIGQGDVSGIVKRTSIVSNTSYTMGSQYTTIYFPNVGTLPTQMSLKLTLGSAPTWRTGAIERVYDFIQTGGSGTEAVLQSHYLNSELNGNDENNLVEWMHIDAGTLTIEYGRSDYNTNENWVSVSHVNVGAFSTVFGAIELVLDEYEALNLTWNGSASTSWVTATNWTPQGAPSDETVVTIPDAATTTYDPSIPETALCGKVTIESGGILNSVDDGQLTVKGSTGAWANSGTFAPGTGTVIFANGNETETVTISGTNNFYNLTVTDKTKFQPVTNSVINIEGAFTANTSNCILDFITNSITIGYNGSKEQSVVNPDGIYGYHNLSLSGDGTKILPESSVNILGNLTVNAVISATGNTILMAGTSAQNIGGTTAATLNNLTIDNATGVTLTNTELTTVSGTLLINSGKIFEIAAAQKLSVTGTITNSAGNSGFILNSDATGTAELLHTTTDVPATAERYISGDAEDWHFLSSPVSNQSISGDWLPAGTYGNGTGYDMYLWNEPTNCWIYKLNTTSTINWNTVHSGSDFEVGRGYLYSVQETTPTKEFAGNLNNGTQTIPLTYSSLVDSIKGFNFVGNPYPCSIDWMASSGWTRDKLATSGSGNDMWIWNPDGGNYGVCNSATGTGTNSVTQYIAAMQGFFVRAVSAGNLVMTNDTRVHDATTAWKSAQIKPTTISAIVYSESDQTFDEIRMLFGYTDNHSGAAKLFSPLETAPSLYLPTELENFSIRYLNDTVSNPHVPLSFKAGRNGDYTINFNFNNGDFETVILEDKQTKDFIDLTMESDYRFRASKTDNEDRFVIHFGEIQPEANLVLPAHIYSSAGNVVLDLSMVNEITDVKIVDVLGRTILQKSVPGNEIHRLPMNVKSQVIIVFAKTQNALVSKKVFVY